MSSWTHPEISVLVTENLSLGRKKDVLKISTIPHNNPPFLADACFVFTPRSRDRHTGIPQWGSVGTNDQLGLDARGVFSSSILPTASLWTTPLNLNEMF